MPSATFANNKRRRHYQRDAMDAVALQLEISARIPKGYQPTRDLLDAIVRQWANDVAPPSGIDIRIIDWKRPGGASQLVTDQQEAKMRFRGLLQAGRFAVRLRSY